MIANIKRSLINHFACITHTHIILYPVWYVHRLELNFSKYWWKKMDFEERNVKKFFAISPVSWKGNIFWEKLFFFSWWLCEIHYSREKGVIWVRKSVLEKFLFFLENLNFSRRFFLWIKLSLILFPDIPNPIDFAWYFFP